MDDPVRDDLVWRRNAPEKRTYTLSDEGAPFNLTGFQFRLQVRLYPGAAGAALITLSMAAEGSPGFHLDDAINGIFTLTPPTVAQLAALPAPVDLASGQGAELFYDILLIHPDGAPEVFQEGRILPRSGTTRL